MDPDSSDAEPDSPPRSPDSGADGPDSPDDFQKNDDKWSPKSDSRSRPESSPGAAPASSVDSPERERPAERTSDCETEPQDDTSRKSTNKEPSPEANVNISHEDLSDVSDLESTGIVSEEDKVRRDPDKRSVAKIQDDNDKQNSDRGQVNGDAQKSNSRSPSTTSIDQTRFEKLSLDKTNKTEDDVEEQLDFEAEEGECLETPIASKAKCAESNNNNKHAEKDKDDGEASGAASSLEEGEVTDDDERRPEETEPRPVCRFYSRGQCTWGVSCRFLHPGVTDKGNYTMFDMVRSMPAGYAQHHAVHNAHVPPSIGLQNYASRTETPLTESAWERGLRTAKEMLRKANKRKEQEPDFEEKKMHLTLGGGGAGRGSLGPGEEDDADLAAYAGYPPPESPPPIKREREEYLRIPDRMYPPRERIRYPERIAHLSPSPHRGALPLYDDKIDDRMLGQKTRRTRTTREVIVQRAPGSSSRGDEWSDPWMRGGGNRSPSARRRSREKEPKRKRKYSSGSSYSSSSSHSSSSGRSGSVSKKRKRKASSPRLRRSGLSPSVIVQERRAANARAVAMNPPAPSARKRAPSPAAIRQHAANPPAPQSTKSAVDEFGRTKQMKPKQRQKKMYSKSSSSGSDSSSSSSDSDSDSRSSSSSDNSAVHRSKLSAAAGRGLGGSLDKKTLTGKTTTGNRLLSPKYLSATNQKKDSLDNEQRKDATTLKKRLASSPVSESAPAKKPVSRREELLKQLKAVEDAIARKRSKV